MGWIGVSRGFGWRRDPDRSPHSDGRGLPGCPSHRPAISACHTAGSSHEYGEGESGNMVRSEDRGRSGAALRGPGTHCANPRRRLRSNWVLERSARGTRTRSSNWIREVGRQCTERNRLSDVDCIGPARGASHVRLKPGPGQLVELERDDFGAVDATAQDGSLRLHRSIREPEWLVAAGTGERRKLSRPLVVENTHGRRLVWMGGGELQAHHQRQSTSRSRLRTRARQTRGSVFGARRTAEGIERRGGGAGHVSLHAGRVYTGPSANSAGGRFEGGAVGGERIEVSAG